VSRVLLGKDLAALSKSSLVLSQRIDIFSILQAAATPLIGYQPRNPTDSQTLVWFARDARI